jgi:hypothetical protein
VALRDLEGDLVNQIDLLAVLADGETDFFEFEHDGKVGME